MIDNEKEIWRSHPDIPVIEVSTFGRVRTRDRMVSGKGNGTQLAKGQVLKQFNNGSGYLRVNFRINGKQMNKLVHRLVAQTFIQNSDSLPEINHKDNNPLNNNVSNLEWCSHSYNIQYRDKCGHTAKNNAPKSPVFAVNLTTLEIYRYPSQHEAGRVLGVPQQSVNAVIKGRYKQTHGFWFTNDDKNAGDTIKQKLYEIKHQATLKIH